MMLSSPPCPDRLWGPLRHLCSGYRGLLAPGVKRSEREVDHSPPFSAEVKMRGAVHPPPNH
jgi:hypothetical protein